MALAESAATKAVSRAAVSTAMEVGERARAVRAAVPQELGKAVATEMRVGEEGSEGSRGSSRHTSS